LVVVHAVKAYLGASWREVGRCPVIVVLMIGGLLSPAVCLRPPGCGNAFTTYGVMIYDITVYDIMVYDITVYE
jgi:hypothetical protein